jgi:hypothetical protein
MGQFDAEINAWILNAQQPWSLTYPDPYVFRLELRPADHYASDYSTSIQRTEVTFNQQSPASFHVNQPIDVKYGLTIEPGATNTTNWTVLNQIGYLNPIPGDSGVPPFGVYLGLGDHMYIQMRNGSIPKGKIIWKDPNPIQRGHQYQMDVQFQFGKNGYLHITRDGQQIINYNGDFGLGDHLYSWNLDIYRPNASQTMAVDFSHTQITTPSGTAYLTSQGWDTTRPSDWTSGAISPPPGSTGTGTGTDTGTGIGTGKGASSSGSSTGGSSSSSSTTATSNDPPPNHTHHSYTGTSSQSHWSSSHSKASTATANAFTASGDRATLMDNHYQHYWTWTSSHSSTGVSTATANTSTATLMDTQHDWLISSHAYYSYWC